MTANASQFVGEIPRNYDERLGPVIFEDFAVDLAKRVTGLQPRSVLELAAGTGIVTQKLRSGLPTSTRVVATDLNDGMLDIARKKLANTEYVEFTPADAMALPFADSEFDLVACQFGVMFFPNKPASFRETRRVLRAGGHYVFNVWASMSENPFSEVAQEVAAEFFPDDPPGFYRVPFSYFDPTAVAADVKAGGFAEVECEALSIEKAVTDWSAFARGLVFGNPLIDEIRQRGGVDPNDVARAAENHLRNRFGDQPSHMPLRATIYVATA
jgi:SAM-dependent methyltransferase